MITVGCPVLVQVLGIQNKELSKRYSSTRQSIELLKVILHNTEQGEPRERQ